MIWCGKPRGSGPLATGRRKFEDNIIKVILKTYDWTAWNIIRQAHGQGQTAGFCVHGNEILGPIKCDDFLD